MTKTCPIRYFLATPSAPTAAVTSFGYGAIQCGAKAAYVEDEVMAVIDAGPGAAVTYKADVNGGGVAGGAVAVDISGATDAASVAAILKIAIDAQAQAIEVVDDEATGLLSLTHSATGQALVTITEAVTDPSHTVTGFISGATSHQYKVVFVDDNGGLTIASAAVTQAAGPATLSEDEFITVAGTANAKTAAVKVYRTVGGVTQGLIGEAVITPVTFAYALDDTGLVGDASTASIANTTGLGDPMDVSELESLYVQCSGTFVGTVQLQGTLGPDAWMDEGSAFTGVSSAPVQIAESYAKLRCKMTAYTSGAPVITVAGHIDNA